MARSPSVLIVLCAFGDGGQLAGRCQAHEARIVEPVNYHWGIGLGVTFSLDQTLHCLQVARMRGCPGR
jgi:hypothetical protein